jgi:hypothetical protein
MATKQVTFGSVGPFMYDDTVFAAVDTSGQLLVATVPTLATHVVRKTDMDALFTVAGTYTPTLTNVANIDASTAVQCQYLRVGSVVTVSGEVLVDPTTIAVLTQLGISLPIASNILATADCAGTGAGGIGATGVTLIRGDTGNNRAEMAWFTQVTVDTRFSIHFTYRII